MHIRNKSLGVVLSIILIIIQNLYILPSYRKVHSIKKTLTLLIRKIIQLEGIYTIISSSENR